ncbi:hypothetical protein [Serratia fonticola]|uniref:hypothetical protein n=1 Tax=Serratia fonticola TaxID=47917 RepID=UPI0034C63276
MILIDPYIFLPAKGGDYNAEKVRKIKDSLKRLLNINRHFRYEIIVDQAQWKILEREYIKNLTDSFGDNELNTALISLRQIIKKVNITTAEHIRTWGVKPLFYNFASKEDEEFGNSLACSAFYCISQYNRAYLFVEESFGRNLIEHSTAHSKIKERLRWRIYISSIGLNGAVPVVCISSVRNLQIPWTSRYDYFLPDSGGYSFIPPVNWHLRSTTAVVTKQSKPVFLDILGNGWANPNTPGQAYHWDVYLNDPKWIGERGTDQINVTRYGVPPSQGVSGTIHHVPSKKSGLAKK